MTEDEAKTKWCPFTRVMNINGQGGGNRWDKSGAPAHSPNNSLCIGSACMAWRWGERLESERYCGLAGKP
jgi:hypothetical protein